MLWKTPDLANRRLCDHKEIENKQKKNDHTNITQCVLCNFIDKVATMNMKIISLKKKNLRLSITFIE